MKREVEFRGRQFLLDFKDCTKWLFGSPVKLSDDEITIIPPLYQIPIGVSIEEYKVDPKTIGQYTGMKDKNGKKIYEGDIIRYDFSVNTDHEFIDGYAYPINSESGEFTGVVHYKPSKGFCMYPFIKYDYNTNEKKFHNDIVKEIYQTRCEVIGNIYDNPELMNHE